MSDPGWNPTMLQLCPALPGWRALYVNDGGSTSVRHVAAWALCDLDGERQVLPVLQIDGGVVGVPCGREEEPLLFLEPGESEEASEVRECVAEEAAWRKGAEHA